MSPLVFIERNEFALESRRLGGGLAAIASVRAPGSETPNQDAGAVIPVGSGADAGQAAVLVVADGVGGVRAGAQASGLAVRGLVQALSTCDPGESLRPAILDGIEAANQSVRDLGVGAATTLAIVEVQDGLARPYHVGDSAILIVGQRGRIRVQTVAHSPVGFAVEAGVLDEGEAMHHEHRHVVSNVLGASDMRIEVGSAVRLRPRDSVLVASDGLFDNLHSEEVAERIRKGPLEPACAQLAAEALSRMTQPLEGQPSKPDDLTLVAFRPSGR